VILSASLLGACKNVKIEDHEWCGDLGELGARCFYTISDRRRVLTKEEWDKEKVGKISTSAASVASIKTSILKLCRLTRRCWYSKEREIVEAFGANVQTIGVETKSVPEGGSAASDLNRKPQ